MIPLIYGIGWIIIVIVGWLWLYYAEKKHPEYSYELIGIFIILVALFWPIAIPAIGIYLLIKGPK